MLNNTYHVKCGNLGHLQGWVAWLWALVDDAGWECSPATVKLLTGIERGIFFKGQKHNVRA